MKSFRAKPNRCLWFLLSLLPFVFFFSLSVGAYPLNFSQMACSIAHRVGLAGVGCVTEPTADRVLWFVRLPRVLLSMMVGASLAVSGASMQTLFRNPLADPGLVGVSSGGMLAAALSIFLGWDAFGGLWGHYGLSFFSFLGAVFSMLAVFYLAEAGGRMAISTLLLSGIAINALAGALTSLIIYLSDDIQLRNIVFWTLGSLGGSSWEVLFVFISLGVLPLLWMGRLSKQLDGYSLGDHDALCLGVNVRKLRFLLIFLVTLSVGSGVAFVGIIGFVGLVVPHIVRLLLGGLHHHFLLGSALLGALLLSFADLACRTIVAPAELPIGILTALTGVPLFISLLLRQKENQNRV